MFNTGGRKGELFELRQGLNASNVKDRKNALKRVVASMSLGRDMSSLFPDVVKNTTGDLSMKKLVYLYIINYAHANADLSILIVNTFLKDANDFNPLIRALAIRTMALVPLENITEYLCDPLHAALKDKDPYVRKTAAVCVAKLYDTNPNLAANEGFVAELQELLSDSNPMTVANAVAALAEIANASHSPDLLPLNPQTVSAFLSALSECTEWGQVFILDAIAEYAPVDPSEADQMVERIIPRLQHINPAVVLAAVRVLVRVMPNLDVDEKRTFLVKKMSAPLVTMLSAEPELQFVALRNISLLIRSYPQLISGNVRLLFTSYADPLYVKREKLDILVCIADDANSVTILTELKEYAGEVDVSFSQKAVDSITRIALRVPSTADRIVSILSDLLKRKVQHLIEQITIAVKDITRAYPRRFLEIVLQLCQCVEEVDDPNAKVALIWIIGEHADILPSAVEMLELVATTIEEENVNVQLQMLTACVKALLLRGVEAQVLAERVIRYATEESENIDVRDRGFIYSRIVGMGTDVARKIVLCEKPPVFDTQPPMPEELHQELLSALASVAAVYHKPCKLFEGSKKSSPIGMSFGEAAAEEDLLGLDEDDDDANTGAATSTVANADGAGTTMKPMGTSLLDDILGETQAAVPALPAPPSVPGRAANDFLSDLGLDSLTISNGSGPANGSASTRNVVSGSMVHLLSAERGHGLSISGSIIRDESGATALEFDLSNESESPMSGFAIQLNKNAFGLRPAVPMSMAQPISPGSSSRVTVPLTDGDEADLSKGFMLQTAIKFSPGGVVYFAIDITDSVCSILKRTNGPLTKPVYLETWRNIPDDSEVKGSLEIASDALESMEWISKKLASGGIFTVAKRGHASSPVMYLSAVLAGPNKFVILAELTMPIAGAGRRATLATRTTLPRELSLGALSNFAQTCGALLSR